MSLTSRMSSETKPYAKVTGLPWRIGEFKIEMIYRGPIATCCYPVEEQEDSVDTPIADLQ